MLRSSAKMARLRQAKEEADREVQLYRTNMEAEHQKKISDVLTGLSSATQIYHDHSIVPKKEKKKTIDPFWNEITHTWAVFNEFEILMIW